MVVLATASETKFRAMQMQRVALDLCESINPCDMMNNPPQPPILP